MGALGLGVNAMSPGEVRRGEIERIKSLALPWLPYPHHILVWPSVLNTSLRPP